ncbi:hypothetical protein [Naasia sp. SYSU D00057]|uniref:hypothetical protein n=1 Tax=Naasia sp. SYSU D00057 TaxID=2817380 RepID=UPI001B30E6B2|nr:hypothetical protein [Naasia sp. SYSU D00057]
MSANSSEHLPDQEIGDGFDQTNDLSGDQLGESDGTVAGETTNASERGNDDTLGDSDPEGPAILPRLLGRDNEV